MFKTKKEVKYWLDKHYIIGYTINDDLSVNVDGDVNLYNYGLTEIPVQFNIVNSYFSCAHNQLTSLTGSPKEVNGWFDCHDNLLTSLIGSLKVVNGNFYCEENNLKSLKYLPETSGKLVCDKHLYKTREYKVYLISKKLKEMV